MITTVTITLTKTKSTQLQFDKIDIEKHAWRTQAAWAKKKERLNDGNNNGQATYGARKHAWRTQVAWANISFPSIYY